MKVRQRAPGLYDVHMHWTAALARKTQLPPNARIVADVICIHCGHNLRGIRALGVCGECGKPAEESLYIFPKPRRVVEPLRGMATTCWIWVGLMVFVIVMALTFASCILFLLASLPIVSAYRFAQTLELRWGSGLHNRGEVGWWVRALFWAAGVDLGMSVLLFLEWFFLGAAWAVNIMSAWGSVALVVAWSLMQFCMLLMMGRMANALGKAMGYDRIVQECRVQLIGGAVVAAITLVSFVGGPMIVQATGLGNAPNEFAALFIIFLVFCWGLLFLITAVVLTHTANAVEMETEIDEDVLSSDPEVTGVPERRVPDEPPIPLG